MRNVRLAGGRGCCLRCECEWSKTSQHLLLCKSPHRKWPSGHQFHHPGRGRRWEGNTCTQRACTCTLLVIKVCEMGTKVKHRPPGYQVQTVYG